ncbi:MAG: lipid-binding SYLF domain-containing protein [Pseudomonadota bacterium]
MQNVFSKALFGCLALCALVLSPAGVQAEEVDSSSGNTAKSEAIATVDGAAQTLRNFAADPDMSWYRNNVPRAKAVFVVPSLIKAGFIFGGSGGTGVVLVRDEASNMWRGPSFATIGSASFGFQAGGSVAEVVMMAMTDKGRDALLSNKFQVGADVSVAAGPVGAGAQAATVDIIQYSRSKGIFGGISLEGSVIAVRDSLNHAYYGTAVNPVDILVLGHVSNPQAGKLIQALTKSAGK